jgi:hypothetical protein
VDLYITTRSVRFDYRDTSVIHLPSMELRGIPIFGSDASPSHPFIRFLLLGAPSSRSREGDRKSSKLPTETFCAASGRTTDSSRLTDGKDRIC